MWTSEDTASVEQHFGFAVLKVQNRTNGVTLKITYHSTEMIWEIDEVEKDGMPHIRMLYSRSATALGNQKLIQLMTILEERISLKPAYRLYALTHDEFFTYSFKLEPIHVRERFGVGYWTC